MTEQSSSIIYRQQIFTHAQELNGSARRDYLSTEKAKFSYMLAKVLHERGNLLTKFDQREFDQPTTHVYAGILPNEADIYRTFPLVEGMNGFAAGVGMDTMFDYAANGNFNSVIEADSCMFVSVLSRATLETGRRFHILFDRYPTPQDYLNLFKQDCIDLNMEMVGSEFTQGEQIRLQSMLTQKVNIGTSVEPIEPDESYIYEYFLAKVQHPERGYWISSAERIEKVLRMYENRNLRVIRMNLASAEASETIHQAAGSAHDASFVYSSNASTYSGQNLLAEQISSTVSNLLSSSGLHVRTAYGSSSVEGYISPSPTGLQQVDKRNLPWVYIVEFPKRAILNTDSLRGLQIAYQHDNT